MAMTVVDFVPSILQRALVHCQNSPKIYGPILERSEKSN